MGEARALWVTRFEYDSPARIAQIMAHAAQGKFNIVYFQVRGAGDAFYASEIEPCAISLCGRLGGTPIWDPLAVAIREAHVRGIELHAWLNALSGWGSGSAAACQRLTPSPAGSPHHMLIAWPEWVVVDAQRRPQPCPNAEEYLWVSPGYAAARSHLARVAADIVRRYDVDGIHLDRIRYPGMPWSHDPPSLTGFGLDPAGNGSAWASYRRSLVTLTVRETADSVRAVRQGVALSAAVWGIDRDLWGWRSSQGYSQYFQDPTTWATDGSLDVAVPMTYFTVAATYCAYADWACLLDDHLRRIQSAAGRQLYIGISAAKGAAEVEKQIRLARERGAAGVSIYSYSSANAQNLWSILGGGLFAETAPVPARGAVSGR